MNQKTGAKTVLIVEDSPTQAFRLRSLLENRGLRVKTAENGAVGLKLLQELEPDVIVLDVEMPEMDGLQVCHAIKSSPKTENIPVIMFTAQEDRDVIVNILQLGVIDFIPKDVFADAVLLGTLEQMGLIE